MYRQQRHMKSGYRRIAHSCLIPTAFNKPYIFLHVNKRSPYLSRYERELRHREIPLTLLESDFVYNTTHTDAMIHFHKLWKMLMISNPYPKELYKTTEISLMSSQHSGSSFLSGIHQNQAILRHHIVHDATVACRLHVSLYIRPIRNTAHHGLSHHVIFHFRFHQGSVLQEIAGLAPFLLSVLRFQIKIQLRLQCFA